jgi:hypothetical protein
MSLELLDERRDREKDIGQCRIGFLELAYALEIGLDCAHRRLHSSARTPPVPRRR